MEAATAEGWRDPGIDKMCRRGTKSAFSPIRGARARSGRLDRCFVHQHVRDIVLDEINPTADAAFEGGRTLPELEGFKTNRANQHIEQLLGDHGRPFCRTRVGFPCSVDTTG